MSQSRRMCRRISIHAPRTGSDGLLSSAQRRASNFNPRSPHGERPALRILKRENASDFNPRSPHGERQKYSEILPKRKTKFQSTLPARGATELRHNDGVTESMISIHAPRTGSDLHGSRRRNGASYFNPRSPHGERQINPATMNGSQGISIHAPRTGSDTCGKRRNARVDYFNPRSPHGERLFFQQNRFDFVQFQSTLPARGATRHAERHS